MRYTRILAAGSLILALGGCGDEKPAPAATPPPVMTPMTDDGFRVEWGTPGVPTTIGAGSEFAVGVVVKNVSDQIWMDPRNADARTYAGRSGATRLSLVEGRRHRQAVQGLRKRARRPVGAHPSRPVRGPGGAGHRAPGAGPLSTATRPPPGDRELLPGSGCFDADGARDRHRPAWRGRRAAPRALESRRAPVASLAQRSQARSSWLRSPAPVLGHWARWEAAARGWRRGRGRVRLTPSAAHPFRLRSLHVERVAERVADKP